MNKGQFKHVHTDFRRAGHLRSVRRLEIRYNNGVAQPQRFWFQPVGFDRIRRITGYLVGDLNRFNDAKRAEVTDRVKHCCKGS